MTVAQLCHSQLAHVSYAVQVQGAGELSDDEQGVLHVDAMQFVYPRKACSQPQASPAPKPTLMKAHNVSFDRCPACKGKHKVVVFTRI